MVFSGSGIASSAELTACFNEYKSMVMIEIVLTKLCSFCFTLPYFIRIIEPHCCKTNKIACNYPATKATSAWLHYAIMLMQYAAVFKGCKKADNFQLKKKVFFLFLLKHSLWVHAGYTLELSQ